MDGYKGSEMDGMYGLILKREDDHKLHFKTCQFDSKMPCSIH